ncbi:NADAR family protein [Ktedonobacter racemifer]|uniref:NADAR domain-containing protein n=1 Tax=Ktedonobacter racemifer DSM 44963 TaxID=485913 RepID=D6U4U2_KTERA|nr:NADAR family protein [Ktedonobacter racemifer]EFH81522.1 conserved hypothetical protein [Ktedonobacter racemifer DSM 44963]
MTIYFYTAREEPYGCFSNFSRHGIDLDGAWWPTVEHYFQAQKFAGTPYANKIRIAFTPKQAADLGRSRQHPLRPDWEQVKDEIMLKAVRRKFELHTQLRKLLLATGSEELIENAPSDYYWGCGSDGSGQNKLGQLLMRVRLELSSLPSPT